jgi:hypothetical protein
MPQLNQSRFNFPNPQHTFPPGQVPTFTFFLLHLLEQMPICVKVMSVTHDGSVTVTVVVYVALLPIKRQAGPTVGPSHQFFFSVCTIFIFSLLRIGLNAESFSYALSAVRNVSSRWSVCLCRSLILVEPVLIFSSFANFYCGSLGT